MAGLSAGISNIGRTLSSLPGGSQVGSALGSLTAPSLGPNNPDLATQMKTLGITSPSMLMPGQDTSGMFGPSIAGQAGLPLMIGGTMLSPLGRVGRDVGGGLQALGSLAMLSQLL